MNLVDNSTYMVQDMEVYQTCHVFEYLQSMSSSPWTKSPTVCKTIDILFRCTYVRGSTILITRFATASWISASLKMHNGEHEGRLQSLRRRLDATSDQAAVEAWKGGKY